MKSVQKKEILPFIFSLIITTSFLGGYYIFGKQFFSILWIINGILLAAILAIIMFFTGFIVLKSLFLIAAELSLLIFIAQNYCVSSLRTELSDGALKSLLILGLIYIVVLFFHFFHKVLKEKYKVIEKEKWSKEKIFFVIFSLIFMTVFIVQVYLIMQPIILDLCVFKS